MPFDNLEQIARSLDVSRRTVSRVLRNAPNVAPAMRERVSQFLARERFVPNAAAAQLAAGRTNVVGMVLPLSLSSSIDDYVVKMIKGAFLTAEARRHRLMFFTFGDLDPLEIKGLVQSRTVGGVLFTFVGEKEFDTLRQLRRDEIPVAVINTSTSGIDSFDCDNVLGGRLATRHLLEGNRRRIAFVHGDSNWLSSAQRFEGYRQALAEAGRAVDDHLVFQAYYDMDTARRLTPRLLKAKPDAVFAGNDLMALGLMAGFRESRVRVPQDIAVVGFDDIPMASLPVLETSLTSLGQPVQEIASAAVSRLIDLMTAGRWPRPVRRLFPPTLSIRRSSLPRS